MMNETKNNDYKYDLHLNGAYGHFTKTLNYLINHEYP